MPRVRPSWLTNRRRREQNRNNMRQRQHQRQNAEDDHNDQDPPVVEALNELAELQLEHPVANDPMAQGEEQPDPPRDNPIIQDVPIQLAASHALNNVAEMQLEYPVANDPMA